MISQNVTASTKNMKKFNDKNEIDVEVWAVVEQPEATREAHVPTPPTTQKSLAAESLNDESCETAA